MTPHDYEHAIEAMRPQLVRVAQRITEDAAGAEDVVQQAVWNCYAALATYDPARASLETWVTKTVIRRSIDYRRNEDYHHGGKPEGTMTYEFTEPDRDDNTRRACLKEAHKTEDTGSYTPNYDERLDTRTALDRLERVRPRAARIIRRVYLEGYTLREVAALERVSEQRAGQVMTQGMTLLRKYLTVYEGYMRPPADIIRTA